MVDDPADAVDPKGGVVDLKAADAHKVVVAVVVAVRRETITPTLAQMFPTMASPRH